MSFAHTSPGVTTPLLYESWYPLEASRHVQAASVSLGLLFGQELAVWRSTSGQVHAWENRCPHRSVRLTLGLVVGDQLACRYHGWRYGGEGQCTGIPAHPGMAPPKAACVKTYACIERDGLVWASLRPTAVGGCPALEPGLAYCRVHVVAQRAESLVAAAVADGLSRHSPQVLRSASLGDAGPAWVVVQPISANRTGLHLLVPEESADATNPARRLAANAQLKAAIARWQQAGVHSLSPEALHA